MRFRQFCSAIFKELYYLPHLEKTSFSRASYLKHALDDTSKKRVKKDDKSQNKC